MSEDYVIMFFEKWWWRLTFFFIGYSVCLAVTHLKNFFKRVKFHRDEAKKKANKRRSKKDVED